MNRLNPLNVCLLGLALAALPTPTAAAAEHELTAVIGSGAMTDDATRLYTTGSSPALRGLRAGFAVHDRVAILGEWDQSARGAVLWDQDDLAVAWSTHRFALGARADLPVTTWFRPYVLAEGALLHGRLRVDEERASRVNDGQYTFSGVAPQAIAALGIDIGTPRDEYSGLGVGTWFQVGYGFGGRVDLAELGSIDNDGWLVKFGVGLRR